MLDIARLESGASSYDFTLLDLGEVLGDAVKMVQPSAMEKGVEIRLGARSPNISGVRGDRERLLEVFTNLIDNAIKYNKEGGTVEVVEVADVGGDRVAVTVSDTGIGIPTEEIGLIFERFYRAGNVPGDSGGTGLGLSIVKSIVEAHGGSIEVRSQPGVGTSFIVFLKRA